MGRYQRVVGGNRGSFFIEVTQTPTGFAFSLNGSRPQPLPRADGRRFTGNETVTLTFRRANGDAGPVTELRRDDAGNHSSLKKQ